MGGCFHCFGSSNKDVKGGGKKEFVKEGSTAQTHHVIRVSSDKSRSRGGLELKKEPPVTKDGPTTHIAAQTFTFRELAAATKKFRPESLLGEGGFGRVYKGRLKSTGQVVAVKRIDRNGLQGNKEFLVKVLMCSLLHHQNLVNLIGYSADGDQRLLVYEFLPLGSLKDHLHDLHADKEPLDWNTRMKIAVGVAKGLEYLHDKANPPVIYRDLKSSNILLDERYHPKLSGFGLAKLGPVGDKTHVSKRMIRTYGYCAPEYVMTGQLTLKSNVYSFGVMFLELITGRKANDYTRPSGEINLVAWARPLFKDRRNFPKMADPLLQGRYHKRGLYQALAVAFMCLQEKPATRPLISDVVTALTNIASQTYDPNATPSISNRVGTSTPRHKDERMIMANGLDSPNHHGSPSTHKNSPDYRKQESLREVNTRGSDLGNGEGNGGGSGRKWELDDSNTHRGSPVSAGKGRETPRNRDIDRERAVAEAKMWGENWRKRKKTFAMGSFDAQWDKSRSHGGYLELKKEPPVTKDGPTTHIAAQTFTFRELAAATKKFRPESLLGKGGFGRVCKGRLKSTGQVVAVKQLDRNGLQGNKEFLVEVLMRSLLHHQNLVNLIGYSADGDQRLLVYEFMPLGSLKDHLHDLHADKEPLDWNTRMKIAAGVAKGLEYLHDKANPPFFYRDLKSSNILLDEGYHPKLSGFGLSKLGPVGDKPHCSTRMMGTYGYCAPEYAMFGLLTLKSDVYSFGVVLLELITGRKAIDYTRPSGEINLVAWARPLFKDRSTFPKMADPLLQGRYPKRGLYLALVVAYMCLQDQAATRPLIGDVVTAFINIASQTHDPNATPSISNRVGTSTPRHKDERMNMADGLNSPNHHGSPSTHKNSPDYRKQESLREVNTRGSDLGNGEGNGGGSGKKWGLDDSDSQRDRLVSAGKGRELQEIGILK